MAKKFSPLQKKLDLGGRGRVWPQFIFSGAPNPTLRSFVAEYSTNDVPALISEVPESQRVKKNGSLYDVHSYWSKKPYLAIERFIEHYTNKNALVLDPFAGCGSTLQACLATGRRGIGIDVSPSAAHIAGNTTSWVSSIAFSVARENLLSSLVESLEKIYQVELNGKSYVVANLIHSEQIRCAKCVRLFSILEPYSSDARKACPYCFEVFSTRSRSTEFGPDQIVACELRDSYSSRRGQLHWLSDSSQLRSQIESLGILKLAQPIRELLNIPVPKRLLDFGGRLVTSGSTTLGTLYDNRSIFALHAIQAAVAKEQDEAMRGKMTLAFSAILKNCSKMYRFHEGGGGSPIGAYYVPPIRKELNPLFAIQEKLQAIQISLEEISEWEEKAFIVSNQSSVKLDMPSNSIDYVFTDPPYADTMPFGDLNFLWDGWLFPNQLDRTGEALGENWYSAMLGVFKEVFRVLKPGAYCSVCYHDTSEGTWGDLLDILAEAGLQSIVGRNVLYIETTQRAYQQTVADKVVKRDHVINFVKPTSLLFRVSKIYDSKNLDSIDGQVDVSSFRDYAQQVIRDFLTKSPGATKDRVYDELIGLTVSSRGMEAHDFESLLRTVADEVQEPVRKNLFENEEPNLFGTHVQSRWYLKETADLIDQAEQAKEEAVARRLETYIEDYLSKRPEDEGVHYSDLFEQFLPVHDKPRRLLGDWLPEYFVKTASGTWRVPNQDESKQLETLRVQGTLRRIKRFANALIEGVPIRDKDRPASDSDSLDWLRQCRRAGLYEQGKAIYEKGGLNSANLTDEQQIEAEDDYRICARRGSDETGKPKTKKRKPKEEA